MPRCNIENCKQEATEMCFDGQFMKYTCKPHEEQWKGQPLMPLAIDVLEGRHRKDW